MRRIILNKVYIVILLAIVVGITYSCRKTDYTIESKTEVITDNGSGTGTVFWSSDKEYLLEGFVFVNDGQVLTIEAGTVIRSKTGQGSSASALIVARGGQIIAQGTADKPIIFTVEGDDLQGSVPPEAKGLWGGLIVLGAAPLNLSANEAHIEGIPLYEPRGTYGGFQEDDNSGVLSYISIRHSGTNIGEGNEINGLTLGGVGNQTIIDHIEVISCADDGFEIFGGSPNLRYVVAAFCGDDSFDYDIGYHGKGQFWFAFQEASQGDKLIEADGGIDPITGTPLSNPNILNATMIGRGNSFNQYIATFNRNAGGRLANSIFINQARGISIEYVEGSSSSYGLFETGFLEIESCMFNSIADNTVPGIFTVHANPGVEVADKNQAFQDYITQALNTIEDPGIYVNGYQVNPLPKGNVYDNLASESDSWFETTTYKGAFYTYNWLAGWTLLDQEGFIVSE